MSQYRVIAFRRPGMEISGPSDEWHSVPALVSDQHGNLAVVHHAQTSFHPLPSDERDQHLASVSQEPHHWIKPSGVMEWRDGHVVQARHDGTAYVTPHQEISPSGDPEADPEAASAQLSEDAQGDDPAEGPEPETLLGHAEYQGVPFDYAVHTTTCSSCVHYNPGFGSKPCLLPLEVISQRAQTQYSQFGRCPHYEMGQQTPPDLETEQTQCRGALLQALGGHVTGSVSPDLRIIGQPRRVPGIVEGDEDSPDSQEDATTPGTRGGTQDSSQGDGSAQLSENETLASELHWWDEQYGRADHPEAAAARDRVDNAESDRRHAMIKEIHRTHQQNGGDFNAAIMAHSDTIMRSAEEE